MEPKRCPSCEILKDISEYSKDKTKSSGHRSHCKVCTSAKTKAWSKCRDRKEVRKSHKIWRDSKPKETRREWQLKQRYGITLAIFEEMLAKQDYSCAICKGTCPGYGREYFQVDHCHTTGKVRGLLCVACNIGLGKFKDSADALRTAADYLEISN